MTGTLIGCHRDLSLDLLPHADEAVERKGNAATKAKWLKMKTSILNNADHKWMSGMPDEELRKIGEFYKKRHGEVSKDRSNCRLHLF